MTHDIKVLMSIVAVVFAVVPYLALAARSRARYALFDAATTAGAVVMFVVTEWLGVQLPWALVFTLFVVARLGLFFLCVASIPPEDHRIRARHIGLLAAAAYLLLIPAVLEWPIDGDEPFYLLVSESMLHDRDVDLRNQYADLGKSVTRRTNITPQLGDPVGPNGEQYSRHEPLLSILLIPGLAAGGLFGAVATIALIGGLFAWSLFRLLEEEGFELRTILITLPLILFSPPVIFYSIRIWPEIPAALCFTELLRAGLRLRRSFASPDTRFRKTDAARLALSALLLSLLKVRFAAIAALFLVVLALRRRSPKLLAGLAALLVLPLIVTFVLTGNPLNIHNISELVPRAPSLYLRGIFGTLLDGTTGFLFQAPVWFLALWAVSRPRDLPLSLRDGAIASIGYLFLLMPRPEWHGGWSPPLRYLVVFTPLVALAIATLLRRKNSSSAIVLTVFATVVLVVHGLTWPWRLYHIATGGNFIGDYLSQIYQSDFSRLIPSFIRINDAAIVASCLLVAGIGALLLARRKGWTVPAALSLSLLAFALVALGREGRRAASLVHFEDPHVRHHGGEIYPSEWTVARFRFRGGWTLRAGESMSFQYTGGQSRLFFQSTEPSVVRVAGTQISLPATGGEWREYSVAIPRRPARYDITVEQGSVTFDAMHP